MRSDVNVYLFASRRFAPLVVPQVEVMAFICVFFGFAALSVRGQDMFFAIDGMVLTYVFGVSLFGRFLRMLVCLSSIQTSAPCGVVCDSGPSVAS